MTSSANADRMRRLFDRAWTDGDLAVVDEIVADEFVFSRQGVSGEGGPDQYRSLITSTREVFPDMAYTIEDVVVGADGDKIVLRWTMTGTYEGEYRGIEPTHEPVEMEGIEINRFEDDSLVETWTYPNWVGFLEEVGVLPLGED
jgi:steroid delta-isomerase-like uncharacterized protein